jgi:adenylate kinase
MIIMIIIITGTPGVGKTTVAKSIIKIYNAEYINISEFVISRKLYLEYDEESGSYIIDEDNVKKELRKFLEGIKKNIVVETIYPSLLEEADLIIILRRSPIELYNSLKFRNWSIKKVAENVMAEILGIISQEARTVRGEICEINVTGKKLEEILFNIEKRICENVDWLESEEVQNLMLLLDKIINDNA